MMPKAEELWCWHSVQWQTQSLRGLSVGVLNWILPHWQRAFIPIFLAWIQCVGYVKSKLMRGRLMSDIMWLGER